MQMFDYAKYLQHASCIPVVCAPSIKAIRKLLRQFNAKAAYALERKTDPRVSLFQAQCKPKHELISLHLPRIIAESSRLSIRH